MNRKILTRAGLLLVFTCQMVGPLAAQPRPVPPTVGPLPPNRQPLINTPVVQQMRAGSLTMNYENVDLKVLARIMSELTGRSVILDEGVSGRVTVLSAREVTPDEAWDIFKAALQRAGFAVRQRGNYTQVVPAADARREAGFSSFPARNNGQENTLGVLIMREGDVTQVVQAIRPFMSDPNNVQAYAAGKAIIVLDRSDIVAKVAELVRRLDRATAHVHLQVFFSQFAEAEKLAPILQNLLTRQMVSPGDQPPKVVAFPPTNSLVVQGTDQQIEEVRMILARVDVAKSAPWTVEKPRYFVYRLKNGIADDVAKILGQMLTERKALIAQEQAANPNRVNQSEVLNTQTTTVNGTTVTTALPAGAASTTTANSTQRIPFVSARVSSDPDTNSVVVYVSPVEYAPIQNLLAALDRPRKQVLVHAVIAEVSLSRLLETGARLQGITPAGVVATFNGGATAEQLLSFLAGGQFVLGTASSDTRTINVSGRDVKVPTFFGFITANKTNTDFNLLSAPRLITADHKKATMKVGNVVPFPTGARFSQNGQPLVTYDYKDVGIKLEFTPHMSQSDTVRLELTQEVQEVTSFLNQNLGGFGYVIPLISNRSVKTDVSLKDGETLVIGGLISKRTTNTIMKAPILGDLPLIGALFTDMRKEDRKTTLFIAITPYVIHEPEDVDRIDRAYQEFLASAGKPGASDLETRTTAASKHVVASPYTVNLREPSSPQLEISDLFLQNPQGADKLRQPHVKVSNGPGEVEVVLRGKVRRPDGKVDEFHSEPLRFEAGQTREVLLPPYEFPDMAGNYEFDLEAVAHDRVIARLNLPKRMRIEH